ncbi:matrix metalloproteinase-2-like [Copidosoma floridanum]|uniref:matrix metalloproteinase-2-like n=1 Tax=Copidosoma floridanum TaxID=29053 RepID=UPI0006C9DDAA|nr:matrix metalloproteinase-2-like [Copidosoma floridanum]
MAKCPRLGGLVLVALLALSPSAPAASSASYVDDRTQRYLMNFGYLPKEDSEIGNLRTNDQVTEALRSLQRYGGIPETGEVDEPTKELIRKKRCGMRDEPEDRHRGRVKRFVIHSRWTKYDLTWSLKYPTPRGLQYYEARNEFNLALQLWEKHSNLTFRELPDSDDADIVISFHRGNHGDGYTFDGRGSILAHAFFPGSGRGGDAHFDEDEEWTVGNTDIESGTNLFSVAAHEFGHSLGLAHSSEKGSLMFPWYQGITRDYELPNDDKYGIQQLYGAPTKKLWDYNPRPPTTTTTTTTTRPRTRPTPRPTPRQRHPHRHPNSDYPHNRPSYHPPPKEPYKPSWPHYYPYPTTQPPPPATTTTTTTTTERPYRRYSSIATVGVTSRTTTARQTPTRRKPQGCDLASYDAVSLLRGMIFVFAGPYLWMLSDTGKSTYDRPVEIDRYFRFNRSIERVDAVYERSDGDIVFFIGREYYVFDGNDRRPGYPRRLAALGLPSDLMKIDAAMVWKYNKGTYFFSGHEYWKFDEKTNNVELDYPRDISRFTNVGPNIDAAFHTKNGTTYFFRGKNFWQFDDARMKIVNRKPKSSAHYWMGCPRGVDTNEIDSNDPTYDSQNSAAEAPSFTIALGLGLGLVYQLLTRHAAL